MVGFILEGIPSRPVYRGLTKLSLWGALLLTICAATAVPGSDALPEGPGKEITQRICSQCHGIDVAIGPRHTREGWRRTIADMVARGAPGLSTWTLLVPKPRRSSSITFSM